VLAFFDEKCKKTINNITTPRLFLLKDWLPQSNKPIGKTSCGWWFQAT
jgi:hypothetical protein